MPELPRFPGKEMHVLAHAAEMGIVVLGHERDAQPPAVPRLEMRAKSAVNERKRHDLLVSVACAAARRAIGTRYGEHDT
jgi:hypothetical protein